jgi:uncharacterized protein (TIGR03435 family)
MMNRVMNRGIGIAGFVMLAACLVSGQTTETQPSFEVVSIKTSSPQGGPMGIGFYTYPGGRILATSLTLRQLTYYAYGLEREMYRILGGPRWVDDDRFDVEAKPAASSALSKWAPESFKSPPNAEMRKMTQTLLAERFQLQVHTETRKESVYALVVSKGGSKLKEPASTTVQPFVSYLSHGLRGRNATVAQLIERLADSLKRPVLNETGIRGNFDFLIDYSAEEAALGIAEPLMRALLEQTGLKLETRPGTVDVLVIDHAEKPSGN